MKILRIAALILSGIMLSTIGCQKSELTPEVYLKKGKPDKTTEPDYILDQEPTPIQVYGVWHAGNDYCSWSTIRDIDEFDTKNNWIINRGDNHPSVNLVVLSFVNPMELLHNNTGNPIGGIPVGMTPAIVQYFKAEGIRVMLSVGGITYTDDWNAALEEDAWQLGLNAAAVARELGVGIEIDYEEARSPNLEGLQAFIDAYRSVHGYDATGTNHAARLTIDLAAGDRWLIDICQRATSEWLTTSDPVLDYANAMVPARQPSASGAIENWDEHIDGKPQYAPPISPLAPCKFTGALYLNDRKDIPECVDFNSSLQLATSEYVRKIMPNGAGTTTGMLGFMFWAAECPSTRKVCATNCTDGVGAGSTEFDIPVPMPALRQE